ncbi:MAG: FAD-dependent monooxygenase, partial [Hyphomicrobiales bacterium]
GDEFRARFRNPYAVIHRADLHGVLLEGCIDSGLVEIRTNAHVTGFEQDGTSVSALLDDGEMIKGSALIGADGLHSNIRSRIVADGEPRVSGHTVFRSVIETEHMPEELRWNAATLWAGPKIHIVHYPLKGWKVFNLVATRDTGATEAVTGEPVATETVHMAFSHVCERAQSIIASGNSWKAWVLCDREPVRNWTDARVTLLGDAAHPMLQYFAQGACMAMEDAVCLAHNFESNSSDIEKALAAYNRQRAVRTARLQINSRLMGEHIYHPDGARADVRNAVMRSMSTEDYYQRIEWLYGGTGLASGQ